MRNTLIFALLSIFVFQLQAEDWQVPKDKEAKVAPFKFNEETQKKGTAIFQQNCVSCHGTPGKANFVNLNPPPGDPASDRFSKQKDGSLFFKITNGRGAMPAFKDILTEEQRWQVISFLRSFHKSYQQPEPQASNAGTFGGMKVDVELSYDDLKKVFKVKAIGSKDGKKKGLAGLEMVLLAKRYFGKLPVGEPQTTDQNGEAFFEYKDSLQGDEKGKVDFFIKINAEGLNDLQTSKVFSVGKILKAKPLNDTRAMWTNGTRIPYWLLISYTTIVVAVWSILGYIVFQILKIRKLGKNSNENL